MQVEPHADVQRSPLALSLPDGPLGQSLDAPLAFFLGCEMDFALATCV